jgi:chorismate mutase
MNLQENIPTVMQGAISWFNTLLNKETESDQNEWLTMSEESAVATLHQGLGQQIRNEWGLWSGSALKSDMEKIGFTHPDDMSSAIFLCVHRIRNGKDTDILGQVERYRQYWANLPKMDEKSMEVTNAVGETFRVTTYVAKRKSRFDIAKEA